MHKGEREIFFLNWRNGTLSDDEAASHSLYYIVYTRGGYQGGICYFIVKLSLVRWKVVRVKYTAVRFRQGGCCCARGKNKFKMFDNGVGFIYSSSSLLEGEKEGVANKKMVVVGVEDTKFYI